MSLDGGEELDELQRLLAAKQLFLFEEEVPRAEECQQGTVSPEVQQAGSEDSRG